VNFSGTAGNASYTATARRDSQRARATVLSSGEPPVGASSRVIIGKTPPPQRVQPIVEKQWQELRWTIANFSKFQQI
jgi:hypothetical protein